MLDKNRQLWRSGRRAALPLLFIRRVADNVINVLEGKKKRRTAEKRQRRFSRRHQEDVKNTLLINNVAKRTVSEARDGNRQRTHRLNLDLKCDTLAA